MEPSTLRECLLCRTEVARKGLKEHLSQVHGVKLEDAQQFILQVCCTICESAFTFSSADCSKFYNELMKRWLSKKQKSAKSQR